MREAQRSYQKRKNSAIAQKDHRVDELLRVISNVATDVEHLLATASKAGMMFEDDAMSKSVQRLWGSYDTAINDPALDPDLQQLQRTNNRRNADHICSKNSGRDVAANDISNPLRTRLASANPDMNLTTSLDPSEMSFDLVRFEETTVMQTFQRTSSVNGLMAGRSIFDIVKDRQAAMKEADRTASSSQ